MAAQIFPYGTALTVVWHLSKPDGTDFDITGYTYRVYYRTGNKETEASGSHVTASGNTISIVIPATEPSAPGEYALRLVLYQNNKLFCTLNYNGAFVLSRRLAQDLAVETQQEEVQIVHLYTVAEFYLFTPIIPTVGSDGYWYVNGTKVTDGHGEFVPSSHTMEYDAQTNYIIIDRDRVDSQGHSIAQTITSLADALSTAAEDHETAQEDHSTAAGDHQIAAADHSTATWDHQAIVDMIDLYEPITINGDVTNAPDEEDITSDENDLLKFKDRGVIYGMGYCILRRNKTFAEQITETNTIYEIRYDFDLGEASVEIPSGCVLQFNGGKVSNGTLVGNKTSVQAASVETFDCVLIGSWDFQEIFVEWFGAKGDGVTDDSDAIQLALDASLWRADEGSGVTSVFLQGNRTYAIGKSLNVKPFTSFGGQVLCDKEIAPVLKGLVSNLNLITLTTHLTYPSRINIHNLVLSGVDSSDRGCGISCDQTSVRYTVIDSIHLLNLLKGIDFELPYSSTINKLKIRNVSASNSVGIPISINSQGYVYGVIIEDCSFNLTKIGGIRMVSGRGQTVPNIIRNCTFDHCVTNYNLDDYDEFGASAVYIKSNYGITEITNCYFETNCPLKSNSDPVQTEHGFVEAKTSTGYTYITNPDWDKTGEIVFEGNSSTNLIVSGSHFSYNYLCISLLNRGNLTFTNNEVMVPGVATYGIDDSFPICPELVKIKDLTTACQHISVFLEQCGVQRANNASWGDLIKEAIDVVPGTSPLYLTAHVDMPSINRIFDISYTRAGSQIKYYIGGDVSDNWGKLPTLASSFAKAVQFLNSFIGIYSRESFEVVFVLVNDESVSGSGTIDIPSGKYKFISLDPSDRKTLSLSKEVQFVNSEVVFDNVVIEKAAQTARLSLYNCDVVCYDCELRTTVSNHAYGVMNTYGVCKIAIDKGSITLASGQTARPFIVKSGGILHTKVSSGTTNADSLPFDSDENILSGSTLPTSMRDTDGFKGERYFYTVPGIPVFWDGVNFINPSGAIIDSSVTAVKGASSVRTAMSLTSQHEGLEFYDTTLKKKVLWNGTAWVNLDGTALA